MPYAVLLLFLTFSYQQCFAETFADSLGIAWNSSVEEVIQKGVMIKKIKTEGRFSHFNLKNSPSNPFPQATYEILFDNVYQLQKITIVNPMINKDFDGAKVKKQYLLIKEVLMEKYGKPSVELEKVSDRTGRFAFYQCLRLSGCGQWASTFSSADEIVMLEVKAEDIGKGFVQIIIEGPNWLDALYENKMTIL